MSIDTRFLQSAPDKVKAAARSGMQFVRENPRLSMGSAAAMLLAPAVFKNDQRGYMQTAAVTTPLITAGTIAAPSVVGAFRSQFSKHAKPAARRVADQWKATQERKGVSYEDIRQATQDYSSQSVPLNIYQDVMRRHYSGRMSKPAADLTPERNALTSHLKTILDDTKSPEASRIFLSNAIHSEKLRSLNPEGLISYNEFLKARVPTELHWKTTSGMSPFAPSLSDEEISSAIESQLGNDQFVRGMNSRLQRYTKKKFSFLSTEAAYSEDVALPPMSALWGKSVEAQMQLKAERPDLYKAVDELTQIPGFDPDRLEMFTINQPVNKIVALKYRDLTIPVVQKDGSVYVGDNFRRIGISRQVYTEDGVFKADVYGVEALKARRFSFKQIQEELARVNIFGGIDSNEDWTSLMAPAGGEFQMTDGGFAIRSRTAVASRLYGFKNTTLKKDGTLKVEWVGFDKLNPESTERVLQSVPKKHGFTVIGPDSNLGKGTFQLKELENLVPYPPSVEKQTGQYRAWSKGTKLTKAPAFSERANGGVRDSLAPFFETDYMHKIAPGFETRGVAVRAAGISPAEQALFGFLPESVEELPAYENQAIQILMREHSIESHQASKAWMELSTWLSHPENLKAMKHLGNLGEGASIARRGLYGLGTERIVNYEVDSSYIKGWQNLYGTPLEDVLPKGSTPVLGFQGGDPRVPQGHRNYIENVQDMGDGTSRVVVREVNPFGLGTKVEKNGIKGLVSDVVGSDEMDLIREGLNRYHQATGTGGHVPEGVEIFQPLITAQGKEDAREVGLNILSDTFRRLDQVGELNQVQSYVGQFEERGYHYNRSTGKLSTAGKDAQWAETSKLIESFFEDISQRIKEKKIAGDSFMQHYAGARESTYADFAHRYADPGTMYAWDSTMESVPQQVKVTQDMLTQLTARGYHGAAGDILDRLHYPDGDPQMTRQLEKYLKGDTNAIQRSVDYTQALKNGELPDLSSAEGRLGTVFDTGRSEFDENFLVKFPDGTEVPRLGHKAHGGKVNRYGTGGFSASESEKAFRKLTGLYAEGSPSAEASEAARAAYIDTLKPFLVGKDSFYRADALDPHMAIGDFLVPHASSLHYEDGSVNPFEMSIGEDLAKKLMDDETRSALSRGEDVFAAVARHPVSDMPFYKVTIDKRLNYTNAVGIGEGSRALHMADYDKDTMYAFFMKKGSAGAAEAAAAVSGENPLQRSNLEFQRFLEGMGDDPAAYFQMSQEHLNALDKNLQDLGVESETIKKLKPLFGKEGRFRKPMYDLDQAILARSTSKSIGAFSNNLTEALIALENNRNVTSVEDKQKLARFFFTSMRQGPISSSKLKGDATMSYSQAMGISESLQKGLENDDFDKFYGVIGELAQAQDRASDRAVFNNWKAANRDLFKAYHSGYDREAVAQATKVLVTSADRAQTVKSLGMDEGLLGYVQAASRTEEEAQTVTGGAAGAAAQMSAETLGMWNRMKTAATESRSAFRESKAGLIVGAGVALAMVAGVATTSIARRGAEPVFGRDSGSRYRPEEGAGVSDQTPGGAMEGSRAARPRRTLIPSLPQTRTATVAPLGETADLDVRMRAQDRSRAQETAKTLRRIATDGDSNVTINYQSQKRTSLRSRERMRDVLDQD